MYVSLLLQQTPKRGHIAQIVIIKEVNQTMNEKGLTYKNESDNNIFYKRRHPATIHVTANNYRPRLTDLLTSMSYL